MNSPLDEKLDIENLPKRAVEKLKKCAAEHGTAFTKKEIAHICLGAQAVIGLIIDDIEEAKTKDEAETSLAA